MRHFYLCVNFSYVHFLTKTVRLVSPFREGIIFFVPPPTGSPTCPPDSLPDLSPDSLPFLKGRIKEGIQGGTKGGLMKKSKRGFKGGIKRRGFLFLTFKAGGADTILRPPRHSKIFEVMCELCNLLTIF